MYVRTDGLNEIGSYADALKKWTETKPIRGRDDNVRPLGPRSKHGHLNIRMKGDNVALRLYHTDIIVWHPDDTFDVDGYNSISTDMVFGRLAPRGVTSQFACSGYSVLWFGRRWGDDRARGYALKNGRAHIIHDKKGNWMIDPKTPPVKFEQSYVERSVARAQLEKTNYHEFQTWVTAKDKLVDDWGLIGHASQIGYDEWLTLLANRKQWDRLVLSYRSTLGRSYRYGPTPPHVPLSGLFLQLRRLIYTPAIWSSREIDYVTDWRQLSNICKSGSL